MHRLGTSYSRPSEWERSPAYYSRLTLSPSTGVNRPIRQYPSPLTNENENVENPSPIRLFRTELLDIGHSDTYYDLCKSLRPFYYI